MDNKIIIRRLLLLEKKVKDLQKKVALMEKSSMGGSFTTHAKDFEKFSKSMIEVNGLISELNKNLNELW